MFNIWLNTCNVEIDQQNNDGLTLSITASSNENLSIVKYLCEHGANKEIKTPNGLTPSELTNLNEIKRLFNEFRIKMKYLNYKNLNINIKK